MMFDSSPERGILAFLDEKSKQLQLLSPIVVQVHTENHVNDDQYVRNK